MAQTQTPAILRYDGRYIRHTPSSAVYGGDVVEVGDMPLIAPVDIPANEEGALDTDGIYDVPNEDGLSGSEGDAIYWDNNGNPEVGTAGTGCATTTASGNKLMGFATADWVATATYIRVKQTCAKRTTTIGGSVTADDITGSDAIMNVTGKAGAAGSAGGTVPIAGGAGHTNGAGGAAGVTGGAGAGTGAGGAVNLTGGASGSGATGNGGASTVVGGAAASTNGAGGAAGVTGGAGAGTGAGGAVNLTGGASGSGATGNGGAATVVGGAAASTDGAGGAAGVTGGAGSGTGAGGAVNLTGGASGSGATGNGGTATVAGGDASSTNGNGGDVELTPGALAGTGRDGRVHVGGFGALVKAQTIAMNDAQVALTAVTLTGNWLLVDPESGEASENLLLPPEADMADVILFIKNTGGEHIALQNDAGGAIGTIEDAEAAIVHCDGTTWTIIQFTETT